MRIENEEDKHKWSLPEGMATYANDLIDHYLSDKDLKEKVLITDPCPENIRKNKKLDDFLVDFVKKDKKAYEIESVLERSQKRMSDVMGPICKLWSNFDHANKNPEAEDLMTVEEDLHLIEKTMTLVGQTTNWITFERRQNALSTIYPGANIASTLKEKVRLLIRRTTTFLENLSEITMWIQ